MARYKKAICWLRRDLRLEDHAALAQATAESVYVVVAFVFDTCILRELADRDDRRVTFIYESLFELETRLRAIGSRLAICYGDPTVEIPGLARSHQAEAVYVAADYEPYAISRDDAVRNALRASGIEFCAVKDSVLFAPEEVLTQGGEPFRVFTPYSRAWRSNLVPDRDLDVHTTRLDRLCPSDQVVGETLAAWPLERLGFTHASSWLRAGESAGRAVLDGFKNRLAAYATDRDFPAKAGTSALSVYLRFGCVGIREVVRTALAAGPDGEKWLTELIWRDFYQAILAHFPRVVEESFQSKYRNLVYSGSDEDFGAWCEGRTGYPLVDAAMRHFNRTGWMHNRLRMIVASFLTKDLLVDYRKGEAYFARYLLDFDLASNNGGWQWAASTGCDAQPYFRIFNPISQSQKFDPDGEFIRANVPELADLPAPAIHFPSDASTMELLAAGVELGVTYPYPIVDHATQRERALALYKSAG